MKGVDNCENCGRAIGKLEQPYVWRKHVVCAECHVHLSAPAPAGAAAGPTRVPPPLPSSAASGPSQRQHFHVPAAPAPVRTGPAPAAIPVQASAPAPAAGPTLLCNSCGHAFPVGELVSDNGKLLCRRCSFGAAALKAQAAAREQREARTKTAVLLGAGLLLLGGLAGGTFWFVRSGGSSTVATKSGGQGPSQTVAPATAPVESPTHPATQAVAQVKPAPSEAPPDERRTLFPETGLEQKQVSATLAPDAPSIDPAPAPAQAPSTGKGNVAEAAVPAGATSTAQVAAPAPATLPATAPTPTYPEGSAQWFVEKGKALLAQGKFPSALDQFTEAMKKDRNNADAYHGSALCYMNMGGRGLALERFEKALTLYDPPNRSAVFNAAVANLRDNPMRAAKHIQDYLSRDGVPLDEGLHTVMGKALLSVNRQGRQHPTFAAADAFYFQYNEKLNAARTDGRKRWGSEWVPGSDATAKWSRYRTTRDNVERLRQEVDRATKKKTDTWDRLLDQRMGLRLKSTAEQREAKLNYEQAAKAEIALRQQQQTAETEFNSVEKPPMPQVIKPVPMEPSAPPSPGLVR